MSKESAELKKAKIDSMISGFSKAGFNLDSKINEEELIKYLDSRSSTGKFEQALSFKLIQVFSLDKEESISIEDFISGFLQFEEDIKNNYEDLKQKLIEEKEVYNKLIEEMKENSEECQDAKVFGEITDIDIKRKLKGIKEIIIEVIFNDKNKEFHFKLGDNNKADIEFKKFEFKPTSRKDHFEFIMKGVTNKDKVFDIGKKVFPLNDVQSSEEYLVQIEVPEIEDEKKIAAYINAKIILYWNDVSYEQRKKIQEIKINKLNIAITKAEEYLSKLKEIYGENTKTKKKMQKKQSYIVEFNNSKEVLLKVEFNNHKEIPKKVLEQKEIKQEEIKKEEIKPEKIKQEEIKLEEILPQENNEQYNIDVNTYVNNYDNTYTNTYDNTYNNTYDNTYNINQTEGTYNEFNIDNYNNYNNYNYSDNNTNDINIDMNNMNTNINYEEYQTTNTNVAEEIIRRSINKQIVTNSTLPAIYKQKINQVIYDKDVKTLPVIYGGTKVTYENNNNGIYTNNTTDNNTNIYNYEDTNNITQENTYEIKRTQVFKLPPETENYTEYKQVQDYTNMNQVQSYNLENNVENYTNINQETNYGLIQPLYGENNSYEEYIKTNY